MSKDLLKSMERMDALATPEPKVETNPLGELIKKYYKYDSEEKAAKKLREPLNLELKKKMAEAGLEKFEYEDYVASYNAQERTSMNEGRLIARLKELGHTDAIVMVEKADSGKIEELIYDGKLDPELLADCNDTKIVEVLSIKKPKKKAETKLPSKGAKK